MFALARTLLLIATLLCMSGCATTRGAPELPFSSDATGSLFGGDAPYFDPDQDLQDLAKANGIADRDKYMLKVIAAIDLRYAEFKVKFTSERKHTKSIADALTLAMTVAGTLTESVGVKDNYLAGIALITGGMKIYDDNYMYSQTISALIAQMDANRRTRLADMLERMKRQKYDDYPSIAAVHDVMAYYQDGTIVGALIGIQSDAKNSEAAANSRIKSLSK